MRQAERSNQAFIELPQQSKQEANIPFFPPWNSIEQGSNGQTYRDYFIVEEAEQKTLTFL
jgi:hypothetical protein